MNKNTTGYVLATALTALALLMVLLMIYGTLTVNNARTTNASRKSGEGFYAAEAGLSVRANKIRNIFMSQNTPIGSSPGGSDACMVPTNMGTGDYACDTTTVNNRSVKTYVTVGASKPGRIPQGDSFEFLNAIETPYTVVSRANNSQGNPEAITNMIFRSRLVPLFQFAVFFDKDLEFSNTATLDLSGPVHTNKNLFLDSDLTLRGQVTAGNTIYDGWKSENFCKSGTSFVTANGTTQSVTCNSSRTMILDTLNTTAFNGRLKRVAPVQVPTVGDIQPTADGTYWSKADARVVLKRSGTSTWTPYFVDATGNTLLNLSTATGACASVATTSTGFRDNREASNWDSSFYRPPTASNPNYVSTPTTQSNKVLLNLNVRNLLACLETQKGTLGITDGIANKTDDGLVVYATLDDSASVNILSASINGTLGPATSTSRSQSNPPVPNNYGVRLINADTLTSTNSADPAIKGLTFVTDQAAFIQGNFNSPSTVANGWKPSSVIADSVNVLSNNWNPTTPTTTSQACRWRTRYMRPNTSTATQYNFTNPDTSTTVSTWSFLGTTWRAYSSAGAYTLPTNTNPANAAYDAKSNAPLFCRLATATTIRTAILAGTATTGLEEQVYSDASMVTSGGVHNMMRFHEEWGQNNDHPSGAQTLTYEGSLVSLSAPLHSSGNFHLDYWRFYNPPNRVWSFDQKFNSIENLPPLTPRFVTIKQENFTRAFNQ